MWTSDDTKSTTCKGVRVKFACGEYGAGYLYPTVIMINLSKEELPSNDFKVLPIKVLCINGNMDPIYKELGYVHLMGSNVKQSRFFDWFYENITCPILKNIRQ